MTAMQPETPTSAARKEAQAAAATRADIARPVVLAASGLRKAFGGQIVLDGVDLELREGEVILLRGDNGSGKTTLINILTGNLEPDAGTIHYLADGSPREFRFPRRWWQELNPFDHFTPESTANEGIGRMWQDVRLFHSQTLRDNIAVADPHHPGENPIRALFAPGRGNRHEAEITRHADAMLARLGLAGRENSSGDKISLGQSKRVAIARAVAAGARILFLDEPLAGLDRQGITDILGLLKALVETKSLTVVIVEHIFNFTHLNYLVTCHWMLKGGRLLRDRVDPIPMVDSISGIPVSSALPAWFQLLAGNGAEILDEELPRGAHLTRIRRPDRWKTGAKAVLEINNLIVKRGRRTIIGLDEHRETAGFNLTLQEGEIAILQAPNGWGKSTLFDAICGRASSADGSILLIGTATESMSTWDRVRAGLSAGASAGALFSSLKVHEVARLAPASQIRMLDHTPPAFAERTVSSLSGGEKQGLLLRLALPDSNSPHLVLLDEPFAMLDDQSTRRAVGTLLGGLSRHALLILFPSLNP